MWSKEGEIPRLTFQVLSARCQQASSPQTVRYHWEHRHCVICGVAKEEPIQSSKPCSKKHGCAGNPDRPPWTKYREGKGPQEAELPFHRKGPQVADIPRGLNKVVDRVRRSEKQVG